MDNDITINELQHYVHCTRQWGLIAIDGQWRDNHKTIQGNIVHEKVDNPFIREKRGSIIIARSVPLFCDQVGLQGIADCVEFEASPGGIFVPQLSGTFQVRVVEYKNGKPNADGSAKHADSIQVAAQMLCLQSMLGGRTTARSCFLCYNQA